MEEERLDRLLTSLDSTIPVELSSGQGDTLTRPGLRTVLENMCEVLGIQHTDRFIDALIGDILERFDKQHDGHISYQELLLVVKQFKKVPRRVTRHPQNIVVLGAGAFGTALASVFARKGHAVSLYFREEERGFAEQLKLSKRNNMCFPNIVLPQNIRAICGRGELQKEMHSVQLIVLSIPVQFSRKFLSDHKDIFPPGVPFVSTSKGIEMKTLCFMQDILEAVFGARHPLLYLSGPSFAKGLIDGDPTIVTLASMNQKVAKTVQMMLSGPEFRIYTSSDVIGLEISGALKNVLAILSGMASGLNFGPNTQASLITRGWKDIVKIVAMKGGHVDTLLGLAGLGDLMMTCYGGLSRNAQFGRYLSQGLSPEEAVKKVGQVVEGYATVIAACDLAQKLGLQVPVLKGIKDVITGKLHARDMIVFIMSLPLADEFADPLASRRSHL
jgi:glycerol-3-phosphate dehydrogenase (NAD(P)+)